MSGGRVERRLAAILAADVAGYSRLMGLDEEGTHKRLNSHLGELVNPKIKEHSGRAVKSTGDGWLAEFASVVDAVRCAAEIQRGMVEREPEVPEERRIKFRIGINLGDVIAEEHDIFGDGVNVAARLEALAEPGGICVSRTVRDQTRDKLPYPFEDMGEQSVKNIARPIRVYALCPEAVAQLPAIALVFAHRPRRRKKLILIGASTAAAIVIAAGAGWIWSALQPGSSVPAAPASAAHMSIVVLPFANLSNDPERQYFVDGVTEDLTTDLSRIPDLLVISANTAFTYKGKPVVAKQIGRELGVRYVLEGSVQWSGNEIRVNGQLIDAETDTHLWAERFDRERGELFALQNDITSRIANALNPAMIAAEVVRPTANPDAKDYIFRGRALLNKPHTREIMAEAIAAFEHALALDPGSSVAKAWMALALMTRALDFNPSTRVSDIDRADSLSMQALAASPQIALTHAARALVMRARHRCREAITEYETALALNRNNPGALGEIGRCRIYIGPIEEAIPLEEQAIRLSPRDPASVYWYWRIGEAHLLQSHIDEAIRWLERARALNPALWYVRGYLAAAYALKGDKQRAAAELAEAKRWGGDAKWTIADWRKGSRYEDQAILARFADTVLAGLRKAGMPADSG